MKIRITLWLAATTILCFVAFWFGRHQSPPAYNQSYLPMVGTILDRLRAGDTPNVIEKLETMLDLQILAGMHNRPLLDKGDRENLDKALETIARYREQYPRPIHMDTNGMPPLVRKRVEAWIAEQKQIDAFLRKFAGTNEQR